MHEGGAGRRPVGPWGSGVEGLRGIWARLDGRRRAVVVVATLAMFAAVALVARGAGTGDKALLYAGLDAAAAGEVVAALDARGVPYEVRGDAIYVDRASRDLERMALAAEGLPQTGAQGYELLDSLSGFGTTSQMFDAAYWRAKEGELARTILAAPDVRAARVHISAGASRGFGRPETPTAAVTVSTRSGSVAPAQARALRHLVAAAVPGLRPADVAVIDGQGGLVPAEDEAEAPGTRAEELRARAERLLEARVGPGNAVVALTVDTVTETETLRERVVDPESRVAISAEASESESTSQGTAGAVTVASNLPEGDGAGEGERASESESRTLTNYEVSETSREVLRAPGAVRRLTVAVLVNDLPGTGEAGAPASVPRDAEELAALGELVGSAVGLDPARGDVLTIKSMPFEAPEAVGTEGVPGAPLDLMGLLQPAILGLVAVLLGLFVVRPILAPRPGALALPPPEAAPGALARPAASFAQPLAAPPPAALAPPEAEPPPDPVQRLRRLIESRQGETAQILQAWIDEPARAAPRAEAQGERA